MQSCLVSARISFFTPHYGIKEKVMDHGKNFIPAAETTALTVAFAVTLKPHAPADTAAKDAAYKSSRKVLARFITA
jgi:hypothetical protein